MNLSVLLRGVSAGALVLAFSSIIAQAQETLPAIDVGGARQLASRPANTGLPATAAPAAASPFPSEPKTPAEGYVVHNATTALKVDVPLKQTPVSIVVVPKQVMRDEAVTRLPEALENVSGVRSSNTDFATFVYKIRGFASLDIYRNGLIIPFGGSSAQIFDTANIERVEVLKGPASVLYGRAEPGGIINMVTKTPLHEPRYVIDQQIGSFEHYRTQWDFSAPVKEIPGLAYRVSGAYQNNGSFLPFLGGERVIVAPVVSYQPTAWTEFVADFQYSSRDVRPMMGIPAIGAAPAPIPITRAFQEPNEPGENGVNFFGGYKFRQNLNENWKITNRFHYNTGWFSRTTTVPFELQNDLATLSRFTNLQSNQSENFSTNIDVEGRFSTFGANHVFLFGLDYVNRLYDYYYSEGSNYNLPINIYYPLYGTVSRFNYYDAMIGTGFKFHSSNLLRQKGMYVQDHINLLNDRLHVLLGARFDIADVTNGQVNSFGGDYSASKARAIAARLEGRTRSDTGWSPRAGLVFDVTPEISVYGSYSRSFGANNGVSPSGQLFPPQRGVQWEVGLKAQLPKDISATLAFYQLTKSNLTTRDFTTPDPTDVRLAGIQRSRGIELDVLGRVTDRLSVIGNYAYIDAKVIADNPRDPLAPYGSGFLGNHLDNVPRHSGKVFLTYDFGENGLGLRLGGGVTAATHVWGDIQNTFLLPGWARLDGFASYTMLYEGHKLTAQLNLRNITNTRYYDAADVFFSTYTPRLGIYPATPFSAMGTLRFEW